MSAPMLTKARQKKKKFPAPQYQDPLSSQRSLPSRTSARTFQEPLVAQPGLVSKGDCCPLLAWDISGFVQGHHSTGWDFVTLLWLTRAGRLAVALRWPHPGPLLQGRQGSAFSLLLAPASLLWPFAPRSFGEAVHRPRIGSPGSPAL